MRLLDHMFTSLAFACKACDRARADSRGQNGAGMRPPPYCRQGSCCLSAQQPRYAGQLLGRTYAQRAGDRMLAPSQLLERTLRTAPLEVVVRISPTWGCVPDRYRADTALSAQGRRCSPIARTSSRKGRNSLCGLLELHDPQCTIGPPTEGSVPSFGHTSYCLLMSYCMLYWLLRSANPNVLVAVQYKLQQPHNSHKR